MQIPVSQISPNPRQPRKHFDQEYIAGLAESIKSQGLKEPVTVEDNSDGTYTLIKGECRLRAHKLIGLTEIEALVRPATNHDGRQRLVDAMIENVSRDNMNIVDEANGYWVMHNEMKVSVQEISIIVGRKQSRIYHCLKIANLEEPIQELIATGVFPKGLEAIDALLSIPDGESRIKMASTLAKNSATIKMVQKACARYMASKRAKRRLKIPALELSGISEPPFAERPEWDAMYQLGKVPPWQKFTESLMDTCDSCSMRPVASEETCRDCPVVTLCRNVMEKIK